MKSKNKSILKILVIVVLSFISIPLIYRIGFYFWHCYGVIYYNEWKYRDCILENEETPYYHKELSEVLDMLPKPLYVSNTTITRDTIWGTDFLWKPHYRKLMKTNDSIMQLKYARWQLDNKKRPVLVIIFKLQDSVWIAEEVINWHPDKIIID